MADKSKFTADEWKALRDAPHLVSLAVASAGASGLIGTIKEAFSSSAALLEGTKSESPLVQAVCSKEELSAAQQGLRSNLGEIQGADFAAAREKLAALAEDQVRTALDLLATKGDPGDAAAYARFVKVLAERVAQAAKEGGFLGFGGERVSEGERTMLAAISNTLGSARV